MPSTRGMRVENDLLLFVRVVLYQCGQSDLPNGSNSRSSGQ